MMQIVGCKSSQGLLCRCLALHRYTKGGKGFPHSQIAARPGRVIAPCDLLVSFGKLGVIGLHCSHRRWMPGWDSVGRAEFGPLLPRGLARHPARHTNALHRPGGCLRVAEKCSVCCRYWSKAADKSSVIKGLQTVRMKRLPPSCCPRHGLDCQAGNSVRLFQDRTTGRDRALQMRTTCSARHEGHKFCNTGRKLRLRVRVP